jgi:molybdate transport system substrate-binding protein
MKIHIRYIALVTFFMVIFISKASVYGNEEKPVMVFAAASTTNAVTDVAALFIKATGIEVSLSFAASSTLAKQIQNGAPANVYISANKKWMDFLEEKQLINTPSRFDLLSNRIVLISPKDSNIHINISAGSNLEKILGTNRMAMGDPSHVPAGMYAIQALENLGLWKQVKDKLAPTKDVRSALTLVERQEVPLGIVYATDAAISSKINIVGEFPEDSHSPIAYPVALVAGNATPSAEQFLRFLKTPEATTIFITHGFSVR